MGGDKKAEPVVDELEPPPPVVDEPEPPPVHCRPSSVVFLPYSVARSGADFERLVEKGLKAGVAAGDKKFLQEFKSGVRNPEWTGEMGHSPAAAAAAAVAFAGL